MSPNTLLRTKFSVVEQGSLAMGVPFCFDDWITLQTFITTGTDTVSFRFRAGSVNIYVVHTSFSQLQVLFLANFNWTFSNFDYLLYLRVQVLCDFVLWQIKKHLTSIGAPICREETEAVTTKYRIFKRNKKIIVTVTVT